MKLNINNHRDLLKFRIQTKLNFDYLSSNKESHKSGFADVQTNMHRKLFYLFNFSPPSTDFILFVFVVGYRIVIRNQNIVGKVKGAACFVVSSSFCIISICYFGCFPFWLCGWYCCSDCTSSWSLPTLYLVVVKTYTRM